MHNVVFLMTRLTHIADMLELHIFAKGNNSNIIDHVFFISQSGTVKPIYFCELFIFVRKNS